MKPAKLVVVPGTVLGQLKVHLLGEDREPKLVRVQLQLQVAPDDDDNDKGDLDMCIHHLMERRTEELRVNTVGLLFSANSTWRESMRGIRIIIAKATPTQY